MRKFNPILFICFSCCIFSLFATAQSPFPTKLPIIARPVFKKDTFNIITYGAKSDGLALNTKAINLAIQTCSQKGGGVVLIPAGLWLTGPLELKSNVNLHLQQGALLEFTKDFNQYPLVATTYEGLAAYRCMPPISGKGLINIAITGFGIIDGGGDAWHWVNKDRHPERKWNQVVASGGVLNQNGQAWYPTEKSLKGSLTREAGVIKEGKTAKDFEEIKDYLRPNMISLTSCKKVLLEGITFQNSPDWTIHPLLCEDLTLNNVTAKSEWYAPNGDGIDVESCNNVLIENSIFSTGDDAICIKSGRDEQGRKRGVPTQNVIIRNCTVYRGHGGVVIGSEMSGGARKIFVTNCTFIGTDIGLRFKTTRGRGGMVEDIYVKGIQMKDIINEAILFDMYYGIRTTGGITDTTISAGASTPQFQNFYVSDIVCDGAKTGVFIRGLPEMQIKNIHFTNLVLKTNEGVDITEASNIHFTNLQLITNNALPLIKMTNSEVVSLDKLSYETSGKNRNIFEIRGKKTNSISVNGSHFINNGQNILFGDGASQASFKVN